MSVYYSDDSVTLYLGDAAAVLSQLEPGSVDCIVTSPPYFGLRDYGVDGQIGAEPSPQEFVAALVSVFREARRVLADDGTLWVNLGDSYSTHQGKPGVWRAGEYLTAGKGKQAPARNRNGTVGDLPAKNLLGIPWRTAFALQDDGWILRNDIIWSKPNAMPESVTDRLSNRHEHLFMFAKSRRYWFDLDPIREQAVYPAGSPALNWSRDSKEADVPGQSTRQHRSGRARPKNQTPRHVKATDNTGWKSHEPESHPKGRNPGDVWTIPTQPFAEAHFATFPVAIPERCIQAGCKPGGTVLDPFSGSGTTGLAAAKHGRRYVGIDLNREYLDLSLRTRLRQPGLDLEGIGA